MKTCSKCGAQVADNAEFCNICGQKMDTPAAANNATPNPAAAPVGNATLNAAIEKNNNKNVGIIAIAAAAALVLIIIIAIIAASSGGYKKPIKNLVRLMNQRSTNATAYMETSYPKFVLTAYNSYYSLLKKAGPDFIEDFDDDIADYYEDMYDDLADIYGDDFKVTVEFRDAEPLSDRKLDDLRETYEDYFDTFEDDLEYEDADIYDNYADDVDDEYEIDLTDAHINTLLSIASKYASALENMNIQAAYEVDVKLTIEGDDDHDSTKTTIIVAKVNGQWIILNGSSFNLSQDYDYDEEGYYINPVSTLYNLAKNGGFY